MLDAFSSPSKDTQVSVWGWGGRGGGRGAPTEYLQLHYARTSRGGGGGYIILCVLEERPGVCVCVGGGMWCARVCACLRALVWLVRLSAVCVLMRTCV